MRISGAPVVADGEMIGIISLEDLIRAMEHGDRHAPVRDYMTTELVITVHSYESVVKALETVCAHARGPAAGGG